MATLPADRTKLALAQANQVPSAVASAQRNIDTLTEAYDTIDLLNQKVNDHANAAILPHADGSVTTAKLANGAVSTAKIANSAVTAAKVADGVLTADKFVPGALTNETQNALRITALEADFAEQAYKVFDVVGFGALPGIGDNTAAVQAAVDAAKAAGGGIVSFPTSDIPYVIDSVTIDGSNIIIEVNYSTIVKKAGTIGYIFDFKNSLTQVNVGVRNGVLKGDPSTTANGGIGGANNSTTSQINGFLLENLVFKDFAQYGVSINAVSNAYYKNIRVENHGSTAVGATSGIGFVIFADKPQKDCVIDGLYSEINLSSTLNSAAIKIQTCANIQATNIHAVNGLEAIMVIDSTHNSQYTNVIVENTDASNSRPGLSVQSNTTAPNPAITDASYIMDNIKFVGRFSSAFILGDTKYCQFNNFDFSQSTNGSRMILQSNKTVSRCLFNNWGIGSINTKLNTGTTVSLCEFNNVTSTISAMQIKGDDNKFNNCKSVNVIEVQGNNNNLNNCQSIGSTANAFEINGDNNYLIGCSGIKPTGRNLFIIGGAGNRYRNFTMISGTGVQDGGTGTIGRKKGTTAQRPALAANDEGYTYMDTTLAAGGKTIVWNGLAWVDSAGTTV